MPAATEIEKRDRAVIALTLLTGARDGALASLKLKHIDLAQQRLIQDACDVKTKFSKSFPSWFCVALITSSCTLLNSLARLKGLKNLNLSNCYRIVTIEGVFVAMGVSARQALTCR
jgi:hypothetical protein